MNVGSNTTPEPAHDGCRTPEFRRYLKSIPRGESLRIEAAEREFLTARRKRVRMEETTFWEQMQKPGFGYAPLTTGH